MYVQVPVVHGVFGNFASYVEFICDQSVLSRRRARSVCARGTGMFQNAN